MSLKRFGREMLLAAGLLAGGGKEAVAQEMPQPPEATTMAEETDAENLFAIDSFKKQIVRELSSLYPGAEAEHFFNAELDKILARLEGKSKLEKLSAIDAFAKSWLKKDATQRGADIQGGGEKERLEGRHAEAQEHKDWVDGQLKKFLDPKISYDDAMKILQEVVPEDSEIRAGEFNFKRDRGSKDIYLDGQRVDENLRNKLVESSGKK